MTRLLRNPLVIINVLLFTFLALVIMQRTIDVSGAPIFIQNAFAAVKTITGEGTVNQVAAFSATNSIGNSIIYDNGSRVAVGHTSPSTQLDATGFVKGRQGLCIGDDCRSEWPYGESLYMCSRTSIQRSGSLCFVSSKYSGDFVVPEIWDVENCKTQAADNARVFNTAIEMIWVRLDPNQTNGWDLSSGFQSAHWQQMTCHPGQSCGKGFQCWRGS
jgi:hypothetical protein